MIGTKKEIAVFVIILIATLIFLLATKLDSSFSQNNATEELHYVHETHPVSVDHDHDIYC